MSCDGPSVRSVPAERRTLVATPPKRKHHDVTSHSAVYSHLALLITMFMLSLCLMGVSVFVFLGGSTPQKRVLAMLPQNRRRLQLGTEMDHSLWLICLAPLIGGSLAAVLLTVNIYRTFTSGVSLLMSALIGMAMMTISAVLLSFSVYLSYQLVRFPSSSPSMVEPHASAYIHVLQYYQQQPSASTGDAIQKMHRELQCCGVQSIADFYSRRAVAAEPRVKREDSSLHWLPNVVRDCPNDVTSSPPAPPSTLNSSDPNIFCVAPLFCCRDTTQPHCNTVLLPDKGKTDVPASLFHDGCLAAMARSLRDPLLLVAACSLLQLVVAVGCLVQLLIWWRRLRKTRTA